MFFFLGGRAVNGGVPAVGQQISRPVHHSFHVRGPVPLLLGIVPFHRSLSPKAGKIVVGDVGHDNRVGED